MWLFLRSPKRCADACLSWYHMSMSEIKFQLLALPFCILSGCLSILHEMSHLNVHSGSNMCSVEKAGMTQFRNRAGSYHQRGLSQAWG